MKTRRDLLAVLGVGVVGGMAGCNSGNNSTTEPGVGSSSPIPSSTKTRTATETQTAEETESQTETETETGTPEPPVFLDNVPVNGLEMYEERLEDAQAVWSADDIVNALEGADSTAKNQAETLFQNTINAYDNWTNGQELKDATYNLAKSFYTHIDEVRESLDIDLHNFVFNTNTIYGGSIDTTAEAYPTTQENGNLGQPTTHSQNGTITFGQPDPNDPYYLTQLPDQTIWGVSYLQDQIAIEDWEEQHDPTDQQIIESRENSQRVWSEVMPGVGRDEDVIPHSSMFRSQEFQAQYMNPESDLAERMWQTYQGSEHAGNNTVTSIRYDEAQDEFILEDHENFEYGNPLPGGNTILNT